MSIDNPVTSVPVAVEDSATASDSADGAMSVSDGLDGTRVAPHDEAKRERRQFITHNAMAAMGTIAAGVLGLLLQAMVSHRFAPGLYGQVFAVFSFFTVLTQPSAGFSRLVAWTTSRELATTHGSDVESSAMLRLTVTRLTWGGALIGLAFVIGAAPLAHYLGVPTSYIVVGALGVPFMFATSPLLASLQGEQRWLPWSALSIGIALSRVIFVLIFTLWLGKSRRPAGDQRRSGGDLSGRAGDGVAPSPSRQRPCCMATAVALPPDFDHIDRDRFGVVGK